MSQTKYKLPDDLKQQCISLVRGYDRRVKMYHGRRAEIIYSTPEPSDGQPKGGNASDPTYRKNTLLDNLERHPDTLCMVAVEKAKLFIGTDIASEPERRKLVEAIWDSCIEGRNFYFEYCNLALCKTNFYERRRKFLYHIAKNMGYL